MLLDIPNKEKVVIGKFIDQERKYRFKELKQKQFKINTFIEGICSKQTYQKLKKEPLIESQIYDELLKRLGFKYDYTNNRNLENVEQQLYQYYKEYDVKKAKTYIDEIWIPYLDSRKIYPHEYIVLKCLEEDNISRYLESMYMLNDIEKEIFSILLLHKVYQEIECTEIPFETLSIQLNVTRIQYLFVLIKQEKYFQASIVCYELLGSKLSEKEILLCWIAKLFILNAIEPSDFYSQAQKLMKHPKFSECEDTLLVNNVYHVVGLYEYKNHHYEKAWDYFFHIVKDSRFTFPELLLMEHISTLTNKRIPEDLEPIDVLNQEKEYVTLYTYYQYKKEKREYDFLNQYLIESCAPLIPNTYPTWILKGIIRDELQWISKQTKETKYYYQFNRLYK